MSRPNSAEIGPAVRPSVSRSSCWALQSASTSPHPCSASNRHLLVLPSSTGEPPWLKAAHSLTRSSHPHLLGPQGPCADSGASEPVPRAACLRRSLSPLRGSTSQGKVLSAPYLLAAPPNSGCFSSFSPPPFLYCPFLKTCENCRGIRS